MFYMARHLIRVFTTQIYGEEYKCVIISIFRLIPFSYTHIFSLSPSSLKPPIYLPRPVYAINILAT
jgi:hypothetical protein